VVKGSRL